VTPPEEPHLDLAVQDNVKVIDVVENDFGHPVRQLSVCFSLFLQIIEFPQLILIVSAIGYDPRKSQRRHVDSHL
jgi:hypothetical protein